MTIQDSNQNIYKHVIWILCSNRWHSALSEYTICTLQALIMQNFKCILSILQNKLDYIKSLNIDTSNIYTFKSFGISEILKFNKYYSKIKPNTIIVFEGKENFLSKFIWHNKSIPTQIIRFLGTNHDIKKLNNPFKIKLAFSHINKIIVPANLVKLKLKKIITHIPIQTIYLARNQKIFNRNVINIKNGLQTLKQPLLNQPIFTVIARLDPIKGHEKIIRIMSIILNKWSLDIPKPILQFIGKTANLNSNDIKTIGIKYGLNMNEHIRLITNHISNINEYIIHSTLGIIPSIGSEIISRVAQEFLMCGVPIIVSGVGALEEMLFDDTAGASYKGLNDNECADLIIQWAYQSLQESESQKVIRASKAIQLYSLDTMGKNLRDLILHSTPTFF